MLPAPGRTTAAVVASSALHVLVCWNLDDTPAPARRSPETDSLEFQVLVGTPAPPEPTPAALPTPAVTPAPSPTLGKALRAPSAPVTPATPDVPAAAEAISTRQPDSKPSAATATPSPGASPRSGLDLSPGAAARTLTAESGGSFALPVASPGDDRDVDRHAEARLARAISGLQHTGEPDVDSVAQRITSGIAQPWEFILAPMRGARYSYFGIGFDAIIRSDGSVHYRGKNGVQLMGGTVKEIDGRPTPTAGLGFRDSPLVNALGRDAHAAERRRFLEQTRALRELLHERALRAALARADVHLDQRLAQIANKLEVGDDRRGRAELFALWDECAEDEVGKRARQRIEAFAREHCPSDSAQRFAASELLALNRARLSKQTFEPYFADAGADAASP